MRGDFLQVIAVVNASLVGANTYVNGSTLVAITSAAGKVEIDALTAVRLYSRSTRVIEIGDFAVDRQYIRFPIDTDTTDATLTTLALFTPTTRPSTYQVTIHAFTAAGAACAYWSRLVRVVLRSAVAVIDGIDVPASAALPDKNSGIGTCALTIDVSTTTARIRGAGVAATDIKWVVTLTEVK